ncbi:MFS transporter [Streptomyces europaeiscabiei]|uniref:MFS transporter n=1 Tax=Streptomyces europaeiscabiei TaxID=146819 RepID=UPI002E11BB51|nr:MFS transporter [Streptomyces europaeiscabiei]
MTSEARSAPATAPAPDTLTEPVTRVGRRFVGGIALVSLGMWTALYTPVQVLLAQQLETIDPDDKASALGLVTGLGAVIALVATPLAGALSDRTTSRFGRRRPWLAGGALGAALGLVVLAPQTTVAGVALGWCLVQLSLSAMLAGLVAEVPDHVPVAQRAFVSAWVGATQPLAVVLGTVLVTVAVSGTHGGYPLVAAVVILFAVPFVWSVKDARLPRSAVPAVSWSRFLAGFWISPRRHHDFALAWLTRLLVQLGNAAGTLYLLYFLRDEVRYEQRFPGREAEQGLLTLVVIYTIGIVLTAFIGGVVSDRLGRRKSLVTASGVVIAVGSALLAVWPTWPAALVAAGLMGIGYGVYVSVDQALITQVLPNAGDRGRDLGVINIANSIPHVLAPAVAAVLVTHLGGYRSLFAFTSALTLLGAILVQRIRSVP